MARAKSYILESDLPSKMYRIILHHRKHGITGYSLARKVYGEEFRFSVKIYEVLKKLRKLNLIIVEEAKDKKSKLVRPNMEEFVKVLNERKLPEEYELTPKERKTVTNWLNRIDPMDLSETNIDKFEDYISFLEKGLGKLNVLQMYAFFLKLFAYDTKYRKEHNVPDLIKKVLGESNCYPDYKPDHFGSLPDSILEKLQYAIVPTPYTVFFIILGGGWSMASTQKMKR